MCAWSLVAALAGRANAAASSAESAAAVFDSAGCRECHNPEGVASDTRLVFPEPGSPRKVTVAAAAALLELVDVKQPEQSRLLRKPTKQLAHEGGQKIVPGSAEEKALLAWLRDLARAPEAEAASEAISPRGAAAASEGGAFRRLTHAQYDRTVRDLLGDITGPSRDFPPEDFVDGFKNQFGAQSMSPVLAEALSASAQRLSQGAIRSMRLGDPRQLLPCKVPRGRTPTRAAAATCRERFVREFGARAFRRPLTSDEVQRFVGLARANKDFFEGIRTVIEVTLQSPSFLYLVDSSDPARRDFARASRLSYLLWGTMPDAALFAAAGAGELDNAAGTLRAVGRMLADAKARDALDDFVDQWLRTDRVRGAFKDRRAFPQFTPEIGTAMAQETRRVVSDLVWNDHDFRDLLSADYSFVSADLATIYGLAAPAEPFAKVAYPAASERAGIFGQGTFLVGTSKPADTSPTARGLFVREQLLCQKVPAPPPGVNMNLPPIDEEKPKTNRDRLKLHLSDESCARCHNLIDSIGFAFEKFDAMGARQEKLRVDPGFRGPARLGENAGKSANAAQGNAPADPAKPAVELPIDTRGVIAGLKDATFSSSAEVGKILRDSAACQQCMVRQIFRFALGRHETPADRPALDRMFDDFRRAKFRFKDLLMSVVRWSEFPAAGDT